MKLHYKSFGEGGTPLFILHGLLGSLDNWMTVGRKLSQHRRVILADARNHGKSPHDIDAGYLVMAADVNDLMDTIEIQQADILGHSMGGKTAMTFSLIFPERINKLIVTDIAPRYYTGSHAKIFYAMINAPLEQIKDRKALEEYFIQAIPSEAVRMFIMKNLTRGEDGCYYWRPDIQVLWSQYEKLMGFPFIPGEKSTKSNVLWIRGQLSDYILPSDEEVMRSFFPNYNLVTISGAGHWVHADQPYLFSEAVEDFLSS